MPARLLPLAAIVLLLLPALPARAKHVILKSGESLQRGDTTVICVGSRESQPVMITDCQHWDDFNQRCQFERKTYYHGELTCVEECQHWDSFAGRCDYATRCDFRFDQQLFIRTTCDSFDSFNHTCAKTRQEIIPAP